MTASPTKPFSLEVLVGEFGYLADFDAAGVDWAPYEDTVPLLTGYFIENHSGVTLDFDLEMQDSGFAGWQIFAHHKIADGDYVNRAGMLPTRLVGSSFRIIPSSAASPGYSASFTYIPLVNLAT